MNCPHCGKPIIAVLALALAGIAFAQTRGLRYFVPGEAIDHAELVDCDRSEPPNCSAVTLVYKSGSERLLVRKERK